MTLGINTQMSDGEGGDFLPMIKYGAESGRLYRVDRVGGSNGYENVPTELPAGTKIAFDFGSISVGWLHFTAGQAPSLSIVPLGKMIPARPSQDHRQGFVMLVHLGKQGVREFASASKTVTGAIDDLHTAFEAAPEARAGKVPVVEFGGATMTTMKNQHGSKTLYVPNFAIVQWIDRPKEFGARTVPAPGATASPRAPATNGAARQAPKAATPPVRHVGAPDTDEWGGGTLDDEIPF